MERFPVRATIVILTLQYSRLPLKLYFSPKSLLALQYYQYHLFSTITLNGIERMYYLQVHEHFLIQRGTQRATSPMGELLLKAMAKFNFSWLDLCNFKWIRELKFIVCYSPHFCVAHIFIDSSCALSLTFETEASILFFNDAQNFLLFPTKRVADCIVQI